MASLKIALVQQSCSDNQQKNIEKSCRQISMAAEQGAALIILQELHTSRYFCQTEDTVNFKRAEAIPGKTTDIFSELARKYNIVLIISLFEKRAAGLYHNTAVVLETDGHIAGIYRKMHIPDDPGYYEKFYFAPGDLGFTPINTSVGKLGILICWDQWYPEAARLMALAGAELLIYPTAIGYDPADSAEEQLRQLNAWKVVQQGHAVANGVPVIAVNRVGFEVDPSGSTAGIQFWGHSFVAGSQGEIMIEGGGREELLHTKIDLNRSENVRQIWPFLRDRRIDAYQDLKLRFRD